MKFINSSNGPWGIIDPAGSYNPALEYEQQIKAYGTYLLFQLPGIFLTILVISSLFIFRGFFLSTTKNKVFRYSLGIFLIIHYFAYYILQVTYLAVVLKSPNWTSSIHPSFVRSLAEAIPLHVCSLQQLLVGVLLIWPNKKFFSITAPWGLIFPLVAILTPPSKYWSFDNIWYWNYFLLHFLIIFGYLYLYLYDFVRYDHMQLRWAYLSVFILSIAALIWDGIFEVGLMQMGPKGKGGEAWIPGGFPMGSYNVNDPFGYPFGWLPMFVFGTILFSLNHLIIAKLPQLYTYDPHTKSFTKVSWKTTKTYWHIISFKWIFCSKKIIEKDKLRIANKQELRNNKLELEVLNNIKKEQSNE